MNEVCAVIVTRNRNELLLRNIESIRLQSVKADILVFDNASQEDAGEFLKNRLSAQRVKEAVSASTGKAAAVSGSSAGGKKDDPGGMAASYERQADRDPVISCVRLGDDAAAEFTDHDLVVVRSDVNTGGAGGFGEGVAIAYDSGHKYIWLMDDDGYCLNEKTLELLLKRLKDKKNRKAIVNSLVMCAPGEEGGDDLLSFSLLGERYLRDIPQENISGLEVRGDASTFNSTLFSAGLVREAGTVDPKFFIYGDDWDFLERARAAGYEVITAADSRYYHPDSGMGFKRVFGRLVDLRDMTMDNTYFYERNSTWIIMHYRGKRQAWYHVFKTLAKCFLYRKKFFGRTRAALIGILDGWHDRMDRRL